jgi:hypothetical protein
MPNPPGTVTISSPIWFFAAPKQSGMLPIKISPRKEINVKKNMYNIDDKPKPIRIERNCVLVFKGPPRAFLGRIFNIWA